MNLNAGDVKVNLNSPVMSTCAHSKKFHPSLDAENIILELPQEETAKCHCCGSVFNGTNFTPPPFVPTETNNTNVICFKYRNKHYNQYSSDYLKENHGVKMGQDKYEYNGDDRIHQVVTHDAEFPVAYVPGSAYPPPMILPNAHNQLNRLEDNSIYYSYENSRSNKMVKCNQWTVAIYQRQAAALIEETQEDSQLKSSKIAMCTNSLVELLSSAIQVDVSKIMAVLQHPLSCFLKNCGGAVLDRDAVIGSFDVLLTVQNCKRHAGKGNFIGQPSTCELEAIKLSVDAIDQVVERLTVSKVCLSLNIVTTLKLLSSLLQSIVDDGKQGQGNSKTDNFNRSFFNLPTSWAQIRCIAAFAVRLSSIICQFVLPLLDFDKDDSWPKANNFQHAEVTEMSPKRVKLESTDATTYNYGKHSGQLPQNYNVDVPNNVSYNNLTHCESKKIDESKAGESKNNLDNQDATVNCGFSASNSKNTDVNDGLYINNEESVSPNMAHVSNLDTKTIIEDKNRVACKSQDELSLNLTKNNNVQYFFP